MDNRTFSRQQQDLRNEARNLRSGIGPFNARYIADGLRQERLKELIAAKREELAELLTAFADAREEVLGEPPSVPAEQVWGDIVKHCEERSE